MDSVSSEDYDTMTIGSATITQGSSATSVSAITQVLLAQSGDTTDIYYVPSWEQVTFPDGDNVAVLGEHHRAFEKNYSNSIYAPT